MTAITAVTIQNTKGVAGFEELSPATVAEQIRAVAGDIGVDAAKTGMLASAAIVEAVAESATEMSLPNIVVDPVFVSKHGHPLLADDAADALRRSILPLATLVTPNTPTNTRPKKMMTAPPIRCSKSRWARRKLPRRLKDTPRATKIREKPAMKLSACSMMRYRCCRRISASRSAVADMPVMKER